MAHISSGIPTVDISGFLSGDPAATSAVVAAIRAASISPGFFQITGHGISSTQREHFFGALHRFFALPRSTKDSLAKDPVTSTRGYEPPGVQRLEGGVPDRKEGFVWGSEAAAAHMLASGPNKWPAEADCTGFRSEMMRFFDDGMVLARVLLRVLALGLGLPEDRLHALMEGAKVVATCRAHRYLPRSDHAEAPDREARGVGAHTDWTAVTLLMQDDVGGLEVFDHVSKTWIPVPPVRDALVVNLGDLLGE